MSYATIKGTGSFIPEKIVTNQDLEDKIDTSDEWIRERTGIIERRIAAPDDSSSTMGVKAALKALEAAQMQAQEIDLIIVATSTSDCIFPSTACLIQHALGISGCPAFDVNAACAGFNYALSTADQFIKTGFAKKALVIGTEVMSRIIDWTDRGTCILFADGAGAVILEASNEPGIYATQIQANGQYKDLLYTPGPLPLKGIVEPCFMKMKGSEVFKVAVECLGNSVTEILEKNGFTEADLSWLVPHQANSRIIQAVAKRLRLPIEKIIMTVARHGNTSAASIPLALDTAVRDGRIQRGQLLLLEGFGGGFAWGSALIRY